MNDIDRVLGKLEANQEHTDRRLDQIETKLEQLWLFRWQIAGGAAVVTALTTAAFQILMALNK